MRQLLPILLCLLVGTGCGLFGKKDDPLTTAMMGATSCLNNVGPQIKNYVSGSVSQSDWGTTFDCVSSAVTLFKNFVQGSDPKGFTQSDIQILVSRFLITNKSIPPEFIAAVFDLKASIYGGTADILTYDELDQFLAVQDILKTQTTNLIPFLAAKASLPNRGNIVALADAIKNTGAAIANQLNTASNPPMTRAALSNFFNELGKMQDWVRPTDEWVAFLAQAKVLLISGSDQQITGAEWPLLISTLASYGGPLLAIQAALNSSANHLTAPNEGGQLLLDGATRLHDALGMTFTKWNGVIPMTFLAGVVDVLPSEFFPRNTSAVKAGLKDALMPLNSRLLGSITTGFNLKSIDTLLSIFSQGTRAETHLDTIFQLYFVGKPFVSKQDFAAAAGDYSVLSQNANDSFAQGEISRLTSLSSQYPGLFPETGNEMLLTDTSLHSNNNLVKISWIEIITRQVLSAYGNGPAASGSPSGTIADLVYLLADFKTILYALGIVYSDPAVVNNPDPKYPNLNKDLTAIASKRYREASLMTPVSAGASSISLIETTTYLAYLLSTETLTGRIHDFMFGNADKNIVGACPINAARDPFDLDTIEYTCFEKNYFENVDLFWNGLPGLVNYYHSLSTATQASLQTLTAGAVRRDVTDPTINSSDIAGFVGINPYVESVIARFDTSTPGNGIIDRPDGLNNALPIFRNEIQGLIPANFAWVPLDLPKTMLIYLMQKGQSPFKCFNAVTTQEILNLAWWDVTESGASFNADRMTVFGIFASLTPAPSCPQ